MPRTTTLEFTQDQLNEAVETTCDPSQLTHAIGYLASWALDSERYRHCYITLDLKQLEFTACYYDQPRQPGPLDGQWPRPTYVLAAVWHADHFGFHS